MKKYAGLTVLGLLVLLGGLMLGGVRPSIATAHEGNATISCTSVTFNYKDFANAVNVVSEVVTIDSSSVHSGSFSFTGTSGSHTVAILVPQDGVEHTVVASASWDTNGHQGSFREYAKLKCGSDTTTTITTETTPPPRDRCPPGWGPYRGKDGKPGNVECCPDFNNNQICDDEEQKPPPVTTGTVPTIPTPTTPTVTTPTVPTPTIPTVTTPTEPEATTDEETETEPSPPVGRPIKPNKPGKSPSSPPEAVPAGEDTLPFTGFPLLGAVLIGIGMIAGGLGLRKL